MQNRLHHNVIDSHNTQWATEDPQWANGAAGQAAAGERWAGVRRGATPAGGRWWRREALCEPRCLPGRRGERRGSGARHEAAGGRGQPQGAAGGGAAAVMGSGSADARLPCGASAPARRDLPRGAGGR